MIGVRKKRAGTARGSASGQVVAAILGLVVATSFWLAYFDFFSIRSALRGRAIYLLTDAINQRRTVVGG